MLKLSIDIPDNTESVPSTGTPGIYQWRRGKQQRNFPTFYLLIFKTDISKQYIVLEVNQDGNIEIQSCNSSAANQSDWQQIEGSITFTSE